MALRVTAWRGGAEYALEFPMAMMGSGTQTRSQGAQSSLGQVKKVGFFGGTYFWNLISLYMRQQETPIPPDMSLRSGQQSPTVLQPSPNRRPTGKNQKSRALSEKLRAGDGSGGGVQK